MENYHTIEQFINITAAVHDIWAVFVNPLLSRKTGGEYITEWSVGSPIQWRSNDGQIVFSGKIRQITPAELLELQTEDIRYPSKILSTITYTFQAHAGFTRLLLKEKIHYPVSDQDFAEMNKIWKTRLFTISDIATKIDMQ